MLGFEYNNGSTWMNGAAFTNLNVYVPPAISIQYATISPVAGTPSSYTLAGDNISISGQVVNLGANPITTYTATYTDGTTTQSSVITGANITSYDTGSFTITTPYSVALGSHAIKSWVTLTGNTSSAMDTLHTTLVGAAFMPTHQPVIEEAGGCWCGWCPRGLTFMDSIAKEAVINSYKVSLISVHDATSGTDPMAVPVYDNGMVATPGFSGFPSVLVDRKEIIDPSDVFVGYAAHLPDFGFADLTLTPTLTGTTSVSAVATVKPAVDLNGTYQLALVLTEDNVSNTASTYQQHDYYSGGSEGILRDGTTHIDYDLTWSGSYVPPTTEVYNHVARSISGSYTGQPGSLPASMTAGTTYTYTFSSVSLSGWNPNNMRAVLMLIDATKGIILNSVSTGTDFVVTTGIAKNNVNIVGVKVFPNPASNYFNMDINLTSAEKTDITVYNVMGQVVSATKNYDFSAGENIVNIPTDQLSSGVYMVLVSSPSGIYQTKVNIIK
jgi:hypothetical protein